MKGVFKDLVEARREQEGIEPLSCQDRASQELGERLSVVEQIGQAKGIGRGRL